MKGLGWWMRLVGALYVFVFVAAAILRLPVRSEGPPGLLERAAEGDATATFVLDTWLSFGLYIGAVGVALLVASRVPERSRVLVWTVMGMELMGIVTDVNKLHHGLIGPPVVWIVIHATNIVTGYFLTRGSAYIERPPSTSIVRPSK